MRNAMMSIVTVVVLTSTLAWAQIAPVPADHFSDFCLGDINGDEVVDSADLAEMLGSYGFCKRCDEDLDGDGYVGDADVRILAVQWGPCASDEEAFTKSSRTATDVSDGPEITTGDDATNDMLSDQEPQSGRSLARAYRRASAAADDQVEINTGDAATDDMFSDQEPQSGRSLARAYRRSAAADGDQVETETGDDATGDMFSDQEPQSGRSLARQYRRSSAATDGDEIEPNLPPQNEPEEVEPQCPGDLDGNGTIDGDDLAILLASYGRCHRCDADMSGDSYVDQDDIDELMASWGDCPAETLTEASPKRRSRPESLSRG